MPEILTIGLFTAATVFSYLWSLTGLSRFTPQFLALLVIIIIFTFQKSRLWFFFITALIINLIVFTTGAASSPVFFLLYFFLFFIGFQYQFSVTLSYSLVLIILLSLSLNSFTSFLSLCSLLVTAPLIWFIQQLERDLQQEETDFHLWSSLNLRSGLDHIVDAADCLNLTRLNSDQKRLLKTVKKSTSSLLASLDKLQKDL